VFLRWILFFEVDSFIDLRPTHFTISENSPHERQTALTGGKYSPHERQSTLTKRKISAHERQTTSMRGENSVGQLVFV
jgi:hypothetical protein